MVDCGAACRCRLVALESMCRTCDMQIAVLYTVWAGLELQLSLYSSQK